MTEEEYKRYQSEVFKQWRAKNKDRWWNKKKEWDRKNIDKVRKHARDRYHRDTEGYKAREQRRLAEAPDYVRHLHRMAQARYDQKEKLRKQIEALLAEFFFGALLEDQPETPDK
jgi:hypothetical protein